MIELDHLDDLSERVAALESLLLELDGAIPAITREPAATAEQRDDQGVQPVAEPVTPPVRFPDPVTWVDHVLARLWAGRRSWCPRWWEHRDAYERVVWLWRSWEGAMTQQDAGAPDAMANWLLTADLHQQVLQADSGPFANCRSGHGLAAPLLPITDRTPGSDSVIVAPSDAERLFFTAQYPPEPDGRPTDEQ